MERKAAFLSSPLSFLFFSFLFVSFVSVPAVGAADYVPHDRYSDFLTLQRERKEGREYTVAAINRNAEVTVFAIHGDRIEPGTAPIAQALAGKDWNLYRLDVLPLPAGQKTHDFHVTAQHFNDPRAIALAHEALIGLSIHGKQGEDPEVCMGGGNERLAAGIAAELKAASFPVAEPCPQFPMTSPDNIVNRARLGGVEFELTKPLRRELLENPALRAAFLRAIRAPVLRFLHALPSEERRP